MIRTPPGRAWSLSLIGALFFFYAFFQANIMATLETPLMHSFHASAAEIGLVSAYFFYATIIFIIPAGLILDRFPIRKIMLINMLIIIIGTFLFAFSQNLFLVGLARFISGIMMAFGLITCLKLASRVHPPSKMALASSLIITIGMVGGMLSSVLMEEFIKLMGWRSALILIACAGVVIAFILWFIVRLPKEYYEEEKLKKIRSHKSIWQSLWIVIKEGQNWYCGLYTCMVNLPLAILGALFGITYLIQIYGIPHLEAASITSMLFFGMIFGSPFFGWVSDHLSIRRIPMLLGAIACLILTFVLIYVQDMGVVSLFILFFAIGFTSASQVLGYPVITESNAPDVTATALSLASILILGLGYGLGLPFVGWLLDIGWDGQMLKGIAIYSLEAYHYAFLSIPIGIVIGIIMSILMKETHCKSTKRSEG